MAANPHPSLVAEATREFSADLERTTRWTREVLLTRPELYPEIAPLIDRLGELLASRRLINFATNPLRVSFSQEGRVVLDALADIKWRVEREAIACKPVRQALLPGAGSASTVPGPAAAHLPAATRVSSSLWLSMRRMVAGWFLRRLATRRSSRRNPSQPEA
jgi:hypothetical protein